MTPLKQGRKLAGMILIVQSLKLPMQDICCPVNILTRSICLLPSFWRRNDIGIISFYGVCNDICFSVSKIAVIGAGTMGSGIAAQIANADLPVLLLDLPAKTAGQPHAAAAIDRLLESDPPQLMHKKRAQLITTGTIDDDFDKLADCDLVIEAVIEQLPVKQALYKRLHQTISPNCIVTSNTNHSYKPANCRDAN